MRVPKCPWNGATGQVHPKAGRLSRARWRKLSNCGSNPTAYERPRLQREADVLGYFHESDKVDDSWNESGFPRIMISKFGWFYCSFSLFSLLYIIVCNELTFCFLHFLSYLFPLMLSYASFSTYDTHVALGHFASSLCCRTCLNIYSSCSPTRRANTLTTRSRLSYTPQPNRVSLQATPAQG